MAMAGAHAHAGAHAAVRLRAFCASAAASISKECDHILRGESAAALVGEGNSSRRGDRREQDELPAAASQEVLVGGMGDGPADDDRDRVVTAAATTANGDMAGLGLADCGEPLVHLLSRQASRLVALYEAAMPLSPSPSSPVAVGPDGSAEQHDGRAIATARPSAQGMRPSRGGLDAASYGGDVGHDGLVLKRLDDIISIAYSKFYAYLYKDLPLCWRQLYTDASILKFGYLFLSSSQQLREPNGSGADVTAPSIQDASDAAEQSIQEMVRALDLALILAGAGGVARGREWIDAAFDLFESVYNLNSAGDTRATARYNNHSGLRAMTASDDMTPPPAKRSKLDPSTRTAAPGRALAYFSTFEPFTPPVKNPIRRVSADVMDMAAFQQYLDRADPYRGPEPLILTGLLEDWPARGARPWNNPEYLLSRTSGGRRLVPVEIGRSYVDEGWGQKIVTFGEFLRNHIDPTSVAPPQRQPAGALVTTGPDQEWRRTPQASDRSDPRPHPPAPPAPPSSPRNIASRPATAAAAEPPSPPPQSSQQPRDTVAYLAQHQLFLQLPQLRNDVLVPDHCYTAAPRHPTDPAQDQPELEAPLLNAWLGPPGTITPLHTDPYHNLLAQVVGRKYVRLYAPVDGSDVMCARGSEGGVDMGNTSAWDVGVLEGWDVDPGSRGDDSTSAVSPASSGGIARGRDRGGGGDAVNGQGPAAGEDDSDEGEAAARARQQQQQFRAVPFVDCILEPGDTLYIPIGWWHYVRGLSVSFSVSLWWNGGDE